MSSGVIFGLLAGLLWAADGALIGQSAGSNGLFAVLLTACVHDGLAAVWLGIRNIRCKKAPQYIECIRSGRFKGVFFAALLGGAVGMAANVAAIRVGGATMTGVITSSFPAVGAVLSAIFLREKPTRFTVLGIMLVTSGAVFAAGADGFGNAFSGGGATLAVIATVCWAMEGIISKGSMNDMPPEVLIGLRELISFLIYVLVLIPIICSGKASRVTEVFSNPIYIVLASASGAFSYLFWYRSMDICGAAVGMSLNATYALWAVVISGLINRRGLSIITLIGAAIILLGTTCTLYSEAARKEKHNEQEENIGSRN